MCKAYLSFPGFFVVFFLFLLLFFSFYPFLYLGVGTVVVVVVDVAADLPYACNGYIFSQRWGVCVCVCLLLKFLC